jgi:predicted metal-dependent HD superfamily phosphohydrolase
MLSPERIELLQRQWAILLGSFGVSPAEAYPVFDELVAAYSEPHRHYHTLEHIAEMLKVVGKLADQCEDVRTVQLAVWFHDAVYDPTAKDNEERSALMAAERLESLAIMPNHIQRIVELIPFTRHAAPIPTGLPDAAVLLDADLAILGSAEARYQRYAEAIRREYAHVPEDKYRAGRIVVLQQFLNRAHIYLTERMRTEGETQARQNLQAEMERLR